MKAWIKSLHKQLGITMIYVTHDQSEALTLSDRIGIMNGGRLVQTGTPREIYERPRDLFVAEFVGESSTLDATVSSVASGRSVLAIDGETSVVFPAELPFGPGRRVKLVVRPETMVLDGPDDPAWMSMPATVVSETYRGSMIQYQLQACGQSVTALSANQIGLTSRSAGMRTKVCWPAERTQLIAVADGAS
jgi:ABC-type Fe3+/spermidine/putrescine transport system ATPase subunit